MVGGLKRAARRANACDVCRLSMFRELSRQRGERSDEIGASERASRGCARPRLERGRLGFAAWLRINKQPIPVGNHTGI